jgi:hypothetical protein
MIAADRPSLQGNASGLGNWHHSGYIRVDPDQPENERSESEMDSESRATSSLSGALLAITGAIAAIYAVGCRCCPFRNPCHIVS